MAGTISITHHHTVTQNGFKLAMIEAGWSASLFYGDHVLVEVPKGEEDACVQKALGMPIVKNAYRVAKDGDRVVPYYGNLSV